MFRSENLVESAQTQWVYKTEPAHEDEYEPDYPSNFGVK